MDDSIGRFDKQMDDGGASKGSTRLYRRKARKALTLAMSLILFSVIWVILQSPTWQFSHHHHHNHHRNNQKQQLQQGPTRVRWVDPRQVPPIHGKFSRAELIEWGQQLDSVSTTQKHHLKIYSSSDFLPQSKEGEPTIDYTRHEYSYPDPVRIPPPFEEYPPLRPLQDILETWPQDNYDQPPTPFQERLLHFDYQNPLDVQAAIRFRDLELPFKVYNVPELVIAGKKWTLDYLSSQFDTDPGTDHHHHHQTIKKAHGYCEESEDNFFAFFIQEAWKRNIAGPFPTSQNNLSFAKFYAHAVYADKVGLAPEEKHLYWQAGVPPGERHEPASKWTFISLDLPSFSSPNPTFFGFNPDEQKGIQCRFGERGVVAATHYDAGRNMIAMITGAKRYILSPPKECSKLGILTDPKMGGYRHSYINFGHLSLLSDPDMPLHEREWLNLAKDSLAIDTVLKAGEVLYIPSHWFHYIISLQRSAQCNTRSGREVTGNPFFGGMDEVETCQ